ncbi:MAG: type II secretion system F family protein [bacterium]|nr:type II secretion system F family protein [bacterium]
MALYSYEAFSRDGTKVRGVIDAPSVASVKDQLSRQGFFPTKIELAKEEARYGFFRRLFMRGVTAKNKILFTKQMAILLKSGVPLLDALELLIEQFEGRLRTILVNVKDDIKEGISFADALKKYPKVFDSIYVQLVRAGEASGRLEIILERLTQYLERREEIAKRVRGAMQYPLMQLFVAVGVVIVLLVFVVPQMAESFSEQGKALPGPTQFLISLSNFITSHYLILIGIIIAIVSFYRYWRSTPGGARRMDKIKLRLPLIKYVTKTNAVVQFSYTLGMLMEGGVNLAEALDIVVNIIDNRILADTLSEARDKIVKQGKITQYLKQTNIFPPIAIHLINTGEQSGQLDTMLLTVAHNYETELVELIDGLTAKLDPIMLIVMALVVGFIVMSVALPIMQMGQLAGI